MVMILCDTYGLHHFVHLGFGSDYKHCYLEAFWLHNYLGILLQM